MTRCGWARPGVDPFTIPRSFIDKVLWPDTGFTKGQMIDYYARIADTMLPAAPVTNTFTLNAPAEP